MFHWFAIYLGRTLSIKTHLSGSKTIFKCLGRNLSTTEQYIYQFKNIYNLNVKIYFYLVIFLVVSIHPHL